MTIEGIITWVISILLALILGLYSQEMKEWVHEHLRKRSQRSKQNLYMELVDQLYRIDVYGENPSVIVVASWRILFRALRYAVFGLMGMALVAASPSGIVETIGFVVSMFSFVMMSARIQDGLDEHRLVFLSKDEKAKLSNKIKGLKAELDAET